MKKLYKKCTVHPTPPLISDQLSLLPASILTLTVALSPDDREVLCYLLSCSSNNYTNINNINNINKNNDHATSFNCSCFTCYMSFWVRWDASPNRQLIHEIIDAYEDGLNRRVKKEKKKKKIRRRKSNKSSDDNVVIESGELNLVKSELNLVEEEFVESCIGCSDEGEAEEEEELEVEKSSSIRRFVSFVGEKIWGVWK
ncbi:hypothetical protein Leryth_019667 [Lithospermum erythrorhizon]|nr:hypothetical protein Leryth_019667 [Lithospermum erythrorhizon]